MKKLLLFSFLLLLGGIGVKAAEINVVPKDFLEIYNSANDGDVLMLAQGTYSEGINILNDKVITLKSNSGATFTGSVGGSTSNNGGGIVFDGVDIKRGNSYLIDGNLGNIKIIAFKNSNISDVNRCLLRTGTEGYYIDEIIIDNCILSNCGNSGYNLFSPKHIVPRLTVTNSTLYNYTNGESLFFANATDTSNDFNFLFENNTVYKWAKSDDRALVKTQGRYSENSTYLFRNNIVNEPGVNGMTPQMCEVGNYLLHL